MKQCTKCKETKSFESFSKAFVNRDALNCWCRECASLYAKAVYRANPEKRKIASYAWAAANRDKRNAYARKYHKECPHRKGAYLKRFWPHLDGKGALAEYEKLLEDQKGLCAICGNAETVISAKNGKVISLSVDHCHKTGKVRALLCTAHNRAIGFLGDSSEICIKAANYLKKHQ